MTRRVHRGANPADGADRQRVWHDAAVFDLTGPLWHLGIPPVELVLRSLLVYAIFLAALRVSGKRELGQFTVFDLAAVLLAANALQPAITGPDASIPGAAIIVTTLFVANHAVAWTRRRSAFVRRILDAPPTTIAVDGAWIARALDKEGLDDEDLSAALRQHGLEAVQDVRLGVLEHDGSISIVPRQGPEVRIRHQRRRYGGTPRNPE
jgi:uncharacterized membrane protein YcaP (DUF421 family)